MQNATADTQPDAKPDRLAYSVDDFAALAGIGRTKVYAEIRAKRLRAKKLDGRTLILGWHAHAYLDSLPDMKAAA